MVFGRCAPLQQQLAGIVEEKDGEGAVQQAFAVRLQLLAGARGLAGFFVNLVSVPPPITAMAWRRVPVMRAACAMPRAAEIEVLECPAPKWSCSDSARRGKPEIPPN